MCLCSEGHRSQNAVILAPEAAIEPQKTYPSQTDPQESEFEGFRACRNTIVATGE